MAQRRMSTATVFVMPPPESNPNSSPEGTSHPHSEQLHDLISIGEIESALSTSISSTTGSDNDTSLGIRLPLLLRWLTSVQPLATASPQPNLDKKSTQLRNLDSVSCLLEDVAAAHHNAENIEVLVSTLAPTVCKEVVGKLHSISRKKPRNAFLHRQSLAQKDQADYCEWDIDVLDKALHRMSEQDQRKRKRGDQAAATVNKKQKPASGDQYLEKMKKVIDVLEHDINENYDEEMDVEQEEERKSVDSELNGVDGALPSFLDKPDDSHLPMIRCVLHELFTLVKKSINAKEDDTTNSNNTVEGGQQKDSTQLRGSNKSPWISTKPDSILSQTDTITTSSGNGGFGLPILITALMHHAPILRYRHVANALCRACIPQTPKLIMHMAANCPTAFASLLRGCIDAFLLGRKYISSMKILSLGEEEEDINEKAVNIVHISIEAARALASLSRRETYNTIQVLRECGSDVMSSLVMKLLLEVDEVEAASFIVEILSSALSSQTPMHERNKKIGLGASNNGMIPLRCRMINTKQIKNERNGRDVQICTPSELLQDESATGKALSCLSKRIIEQSRMVGKMFCFGKTALFVRAYALLTYSLDEKSSSKYGSIFEETIQAIHILSQSVPGENETPADEFFTLMVSATLFTAVQITASKVIDETVGKVCFQCLQSLLLRPLSLHTKSFVAKIAMIIDGNNDMHLMRLLLQSTIDGTFAIDDEKHFSEISKNFELCRWLKSKFQRGLLESVQGKAMSVEFVLQDASVFIEKMQAEDSNGLDSVVQAIFADANKCFQMSKQLKVWGFIQGSAKLTCRKKSPNIPLVMPLNLERISRRLWADGRNGIEVLPLFMQFVMQLLYALSFLDEDPASPFVIDPRVFPLKETLDSLSGGHCGGASVLHKTLKQYILHYCPDLINDRESGNWLYMNVDKESVCLSDFPVKPIFVCDAINDCMLPSTTDSSGIRAERLFLASRSTYPSATVDVAVIGAILKPPSNRFQRTFFSYIALCRDPLVLMKARSVIWKCNGLRRIMLRVLRDLMSANESIAMKDSVSQNAALRYLTARDTVIFRCLLFVCATASVLDMSESTFTFCDMSVCLMRSIASKRRGVIAALVSQSLPESSVHFLVRFIPESFQDASELVALLMNKDSPLGERLSTAIVALRICVAHISLQDEKATKNLFSVSLEVLSEAFHFVVSGHFGLPVSLFRNENGKDITLICREAILQMISILSKMDAKSHLKNDAIIFVSKIANSCKSENTAGATASKRNLLRGIWDRCDSTVKSLGDTLQ